MDEDRPAQRNDDQDGDDLDGHARQESRPAKPPRHDGKDRKTPEKGDDADGGEGEEHEPPKPPTPRWKKILYGLIAAIAVTALVTGGVLYWLHARHYESTDDAFIDGHMAQMASQVSGRVLQLAVADNQMVQKGQVLVVIDPRDYQVKLDQARAGHANAMAQLAQARANVGVQQAQIDQAQANVRVGESDLAQAQSDLARYRSVDPKAITRQQLDTQNSQTRSSGAKLDASRQAVAAAQAQLESAKAQVQAAQAQVTTQGTEIANAELQLSYTQILAPEAGRVTRRTVEVGQYVSPGQSLLAVVPNDLWVTANFKETQLTYMQEGQPVDITVDTFPDVTFHGRVDSFQKGTGSVFSSLPAENATGNYVKVVQRIPVKITFTGDERDRYRLAPGAVRHAPRHGEIAWQTVRLCPARPRGTTARGCWPSSSRSRPSWRCWTPRSPTSRSATSPARSRRAKTRAPTS